MCGSIVHSQTARRRASYGPMPAYVSVFDTGFFEARSGPAVFADDQDWSRNTVKRNLQLRGAWRETSRHDDVIWEDPTVQRMTGQFLNRYQQQICCGMQLSMKQGNLSSEAY